MSIGKGDQSRLYKTTDGCQSWTLLFTNPDPDGFCDALRFRNRESGWLLGDPVDGRFVVMGTLDGGLHWTRSKTNTLAADDQAGVFAASNSSMIAPNVPSFVTGGPGGAYFYEGDTVCTQVTAKTTRTGCISDFTKFDPIPIPLVGNSASAGGLLRRAVSTTSSSSWSAATTQIPRSAKEPPRILTTTSASGLPRKHSPRLPVRRRLRLRRQNLDHRRPQRHRHLHRRRPQLASPQTQPQIPRRPRRRPALERPLPPLRRRPPRTHRHPPPNSPPTETEVSCDQRSANGALDHQPGAKGTRSGSVASGQHHENHRGLKARSEEGGVAGCWITHP